MACRLTLISWSMPFNAYLQLPVSAHLLKRFCLEAQAWVPKFASFRNSLVRIKIRLDLPSSFIAVFVSCLIALLSQEDVKLLLLHNTLRLQINIYRSCWHTWRCHPIRVGSREALVTPSSSRALLQNARVLLLSGKATVLYC